ncbi:MAG: hypothetical protein HYV07_13465 [Deltaproteobacteria bacterium]|nr:hypothetical protein [Deltaproteobacteria bacterium]
MRRWLVFALASLPAQALADFSDPKPAAEPLPPFAAADYVDHEGHSRFFLTTRWGLGEQDSVWDFEFMFAVQLARGIALTGVVPGGFDSPRDAASVKNREASFFVGNLTLGVEGGDEVQLVKEWDGLGPPTLHLGGALDLYGPTSPKRDGSCPLAATVPCEAVVEVLKLRPMAPGLFLNQTAAFRARLHVGFDVERFAAAVELGLTPAWPLERGTSAYVFLSLGARLRYLISDWLEPYVELATSTLLSDPKPGRFAEGPLYLTPGARLHASNGASVGAFVMIPMAGDSVAPFVVGLDIAGVLRRMTRKIPGHEEFLERGI